MIKILIAEDLGSKTIDKLNEIPEFEISNKRNLTQENFVTEIKSVDAMVVSNTTQLTSFILKGAANLKIIVLTGSGPNHVDTTVASQKKIEIRNTTLAENQECRGLDVIAILKDFFNV